MVIEQIYRQLTINLSRRTAPALKKEDLPKDSTLWAVWNAANPRFPQADNSSHLR